MVPEYVFLMHSLNMGVYLSLIYDGFRILRRVFIHNDFLISLEDIAFWIYAAGAVFMLMYRESNGMLRWFAILGGLFGVLVYQKYLSPVLVKYISLLILWLLSPIKKMIMLMKAVFAERNASKID